MLPREQEPPGERIVEVVYGGGVRRRGPVTMGQANMIRCILRDDPVQINIHDVWPVPPGATVEAVGDALRVLVERHEALRTTFPVAAAGGPPVVQEVAAQGSFAFAVRDHHGAFPDEPARHAEAVARGARSGRFLLERDFPLRLVLLALDGVPAFLAVAASHAAVDGSALVVLHEEWHTLLTCGELPASRALTPVDLAVEESSPAGRLRSEASLRYWERVLRTGPQAVFAEPRVRPGECVAARLTLRSARAGRALAAAAARTGSPAATVLLTAWSVLVAHRAGQEVLVAAAPTANRNRAGLARSVSTLAQDALLMLDVRGPTVDAVLRKAWGAALDAYRHSRFDAVRLWDMIGRTTRERGGQFARDVVFNDVSSVLATRPEGGGRPVADEPELELRWGPEQELPTRVLTFVYATGPVLDLALWADPALFDRGEVEGFLTGLVRLLEAAAAGDVPLAALTEVTGVASAVRGGDWVRVDRCWVSPAAVAAALGEALGGSPVHVAVEGASAEAVLTAYVAGGGGPAPTPEGAHQALMELLPQRCGVLAPHRYVFVERPPAEAGEAGAWRRLPVLTEGSGRRAADAT
ncbi:condensation protein [Streptomyces solincola]|uniref:Condensation protein n=1 Tax=Streptomyces solincola TaxID=2100817 RepID=A0A2S9PZ53_9ACTN|nr:condensation domain-containing protein [Streptomyces solincola]PRH79678.1 condensation protein [Streptomyces solincola]